MTQRVAPWRVVAAAIILAALAGLLAMFAPIYWRNQQLQRYVSALTRTVGASEQSDGVLRAKVADKARGLNLPVAEDNVHIRRSAGDGLHIDVRYFVRMSLPGYTVDLHFYPAAASQ